MVATDAYADATSPTYIYFNPLGRSVWVAVTSPGCAAGQSYEVYDLTSGKTLAAAVDCSVAGGGNGARGPRAGADWGLYLAGKPNTKPPLRPTALLQIPRAAVMIPADVALLITLRPAGTARLKAPPHTPPVANA